MTRLVILLVISCLATVAPAAVKRDEFGGVSPTADHPNSSSGQNYQAGTSGSSQGNLYYYYYPVGDKGKEHGYQASSSNQFTSSVTPGNSNSGSSESGSPHTSALETPTNGQDLSYSAQDLSYSAQNLGSQAGNLGQASGASGVGDYSNQAVGSSNYDQLSSIASQLQQYGFGSGSSANSAFAPSSSAGYSPSGSSYNSGNSYSLNNDASGAGYSSGSGSGPSSSAFPGSVGDASGYSSSGPVPGFNGPTGSGAPGGYGGQPGSIPYSSQGNYNPYQAHGGYDSYNAAASSNHAQYEPPASGYRRYGIGSAILPILALAGLSLLIPTVTSLSTAATGRKRRSIDSPAKDSGLGAYFDRIERYYSLYKNAVEREECMNRILCELGDAMSNVRGKSTLFNVMEKVAPTWMNNKVGALKSGAISAEYGKCKKYTCQ